jgi:hypothetical protein
MTVLSRIRSAVLNPAWICFIWLGLIIGISLVATPARFGAESITRPIALDVSRDVFVAQNQVELLALVLLLLVVRVSGRSRDLWAVCAGLILIVIAQNAWLTPELSARTDMILAGTEPPSSHAHAIYGTLELIKAAALLFLGVRSLSENG